MADLSAIVDQTVRRERGPIVGSLLRLSGSMDAAEEAFQEAVLAALEAWREEIPHNPGAWLMVAARNRARDARRHRAVVDAKADVLRAESVTDAIDTVTDDHLRLIFTCCHPALSIDNQIALTLKVVAGFSTEEIARAFVCGEATVSQRILRAKQTLEATKAAYAIPEREELDARLAAVLGVTYAIFNEGHVALTGPSWMRVDLQAEALRLARLLCDLVPKDAEAFGLLALIAFAASRARTRIDADGVPILLEAQDRSKWDRDLVREGLMALQRARALGLGPYGLQAEIAAAHAIAPSWEVTDWPTILAHYDALMTAAPAPIVALNRAIALSRVQGPAEALAALAPLERALVDHHLFYATRADLRTRLGEDARKDLERALSLATNEGDQSLLRTRLRG